MLRILIGFFTDLYLSGTTFFTLGVVFSGGMLSSTLLAIPLVPVFYVATQPVSERLKMLK